MSSFSPVEARLAIGPVYDSNKPQPRGKYAHVQSETCSLADRVFQGKKSQQKLNPQMVPGTKPIGYVYPNPSPVPVLPRPEVVIAAYGDMIEEHVQRRIFFFFQQLLCCNQTKLHFESAAAQDQGESGKVLQMNLNGVTQEYVMRQAAHSSGNPCVIAYDSSSWERYKADEIPKPKGFVYLKGTDYYRTMNATMEMPKWINDADREIDEKTKASLLREKGEAILNRVSQGVITPDEGVIEYVQEALYEVRSAQIRLKESGKNPAVEEVLFYYENYLLQIQYQMRSDPLFLEKLLDIKLGSATQNEKSKRVILQIRYAAIRNCQVNQSGLIQKIESLKQSTLEQVKAANHNQQLDNFDAAFKTVLVNCPTTDQDRKRVEKLLTFSPFNVEAQMQAGAKKKYDNTKAVISTHEVEIQPVVEEICQDMKKLRIQEKDERGQIVRELRHMKQWSQRKLAEEVKHRFPQAASSHSTISRIENQTKLVTKEIAREFSRVFEVDPTLFIPRFYYE